MWGTLVERLKSLARDDFNFIYNINYRIFFAIKISIIIQAFLFLAFHVPDL